METETHGDRKDVALPAAGLRPAGSVPHPCENYRYGPNDLNPRGTGKTVALPAPSLVVDATDGTLTERPPQGNRVRFKDEHGFRPICPFFELHGSWVIDGVRGDGPITTEVLDAFDLTPADVQWKVEVANLKAHHCTRAEDDRIDATVEVAGNQHQKRPLEGRSPRRRPVPWCPRTARPARLGPDPAAERRLPRTAAALHPRRRTGLRPHEPAPAHHPVSTPRRAAVPLPELPLVRVQDDRQRPADRAGRPLRRGVRRGRRNQLRARGRRVRRPGHRHHR